MKGSNKFLFGGIILFLLSILLAVVMNATGAYEPLTLPFGILVTSGGFFVIVAFFWRMIGAGAETRARIEREREQIERERRKKERASMHAEKKGELLGYLIGFFISLGFTIFTTLKMIEALTIQQDIAEYLGIPIYDPYIPMFILLSLIPTLYLSVRIIKISNEMKRT